MPHYASVPTIYSNALGLAVIPLLVSPFAFYLYALYFDIQHHHLGRFVADALFMPLGLVHGIFLLF
jgi:hypothetical protein